MITFPYLSTYLGTSYTLNDQAFSKYDNRNHVLCFYAFQVANKWKILEAFFKIFTQCQQEQDLNSLTQNPLSTVLPIISTMLARDKNTYKVYVLVKNFQSTLGVTESCIVT
jgi:hypothetical protein